MDKASIVGDAISYLQELQKQVVDMQTDIRNLQTSKTDPEVQDQSTSSCEENNNVDCDHVNISHRENFVEHKILQVILIHDSLELAFIDTSQFIKGMSGNHQIALTIALYSSIYCDIFALH